MASMENASWLGVMTAAAKASTMTAQRRFFLEELVVDGPRRPWRAAPARPGSSNTTPKARMKSAMKVK